MTTQPTDSFKQFNYGLRPSKQIERKIMIDVLLRLSNLDYNLRDYTYLGFGSPFYADFVMFHKYLYMGKMICVEWADVAKRMKFNRPFKFIRLKLGSLSSHIPSIRSAEKYLVWLDYDRSLDNEILQDIDGCLTRLSRRSLFVITVDARPKLPKDLFDFDLDDLSVQARERLIVKTYKDWFSVYLGYRITRDAISRLEVSSMFYQILIERIRQTLSKRTGGLRFIQIFNYLYRDGAPMLTVGGIIGNEEDVGMVERDISGHDFVRTDKEPLVISVPPLTVREKQWLDSRLDKNLSVDHVQFELEEEFLENYRLFYKEYPTFLEALL